MGTSKIIESNHDAGRDFVHLHVHTEYSLLDGANRITDLIDRVRELGMKSVAITDHGVMFGVVMFYQEAIKKDIKPIIGCEVYTAARTRFDKQPGLDSDQGHLVLLAENNKGYKNLMKLVSLSYLEGFYYKPRVDMELLSQYSEGLIALSACLSGDIPKRILSGQYDKAKELALEYERIFGKGNFYLELQENGIAEQRTVNNALIRMSRETGIPIVATNDAHYIRPEDSQAQEILMCIQTGKTLSDESRMRMNTSDLYIRSPKEMWDLFAYAPDAVENAVRIADRCNVELEFGKLHLPQYQPPHGYMSEQYLRKIAEEGLLRRYGGNITPEIRERFEYELSTITQMGYVDYYLIVWDFIKYAKDNGIMVGPGRGSGAGSLIAYCIGITNLDPIKHNLIFERFLNPERVSMPDFDVDFCFVRRQEVIDYVNNKYGREHVSQIITFSTMAARGAIRDVGRVLDIPYAEVDMIAKQIPFGMGMTIQKALEINPELKKMVRENERVKELIETAMKLEGMPRNCSVHAAGVVITKEPVMEYVPLYRGEECITTQYPMKPIEELGLLKMDFLGLRTLTVIRDAIEMIRADHGENIIIDEIPLDDPDVYKLISEGKTDGVFQLESPGMKSFLRELQPDNFEDIIAGISLYRPGPMDRIPKYIANKHNPDRIEYDHPLLEPILSVSYGCMIYQEQVMQVCRDLAGYSMGRSDLVRRAMAKKKADVMKKEREIFIHGLVDENNNIIVPGALRNGVPESVANKIFDEMMDFADYAFNKSHAAAYAYITYQTAWLKAHYPTEYMAALLNSFLGSGEKISQYIAECKRMGIDVLPPDINESGLVFTVVDGKILFGLTAVKNVGSGAVKSILDNRMKYGPFKSFFDFCERIDSSEVNKRCVESLIKCGAFDKIANGAYRSQMIAVHDKLLDSVQQSRRNVFDGQISLFELAGSKSSYIDESYPEMDEYPRKVLLAMEKEMLGLYVTGHPLQEYEDELNSVVTIYSTDLIMENDSERNENDDIREVTEIKGYRDGDTVIVGGIITAVKTKSTKTNNLMAFVSLEDLYGTLELIVFPKVLEKYSVYIHEDSMVLAEGRLSLREDEQGKILVEKIQPLKKEAENLSKAGGSLQPSDRQTPFDQSESQGAGTEIQGPGVVLHISGKEWESRRKTIEPLLGFFGGTTPVYLYDGNNRELLDRKLWVNIRNNQIRELIISELKERLGGNGVEII